MKKVLTIFAGLIIAMPAFATDPEPNPYPTDTVVSASYVKGAYDAVMGVVGTMSGLGTSATTLVGAINEVNGAKQATLTSTNVVVDSNTSGPVVTGVTANNGTVTVAKGEVQIPVSAASGQNVTSHAQIWIQ